MVVQGDKTIDAATFAQIEEYFTSALTIDKHKRFDWIEKTLRHDTSLLQEVRSLLLAHHASDTFLTTPFPVKKTINKITERCPDLTGRRLGVYEVIRKIASGGMGRIYSAKRSDGEYEQVVAIKVVEVSNINIELFLKERQLLADIQHPNIVTLLDGGTLEEGFPYLVMELVDGMPIDAYIDCYQLSPTEIVTLCRDLCQVIDDAHQQGIIHCDLKPDNILVINKGRRKGTLKLLDFGIAHSSKPSSKPYVGITPEYASPQRHQSHVPHRSDDVFSLGIIFGQLLSGKPLTLTEKTNAIKKPYKTADIAALSRHIKNKELKLIFKKATADKRQARYHSASEFQADLNNWLDEKPINAVQGGWWYFYSKYIYRYRNFLLIILIFALFSLTVGQIAGQYFEQQESAELRQESRQDDADEAVEDLDRLLATIPHTPSLEQEVTTLTMNRLHEWEQENPKNQTIKIHYADILIRMGNISGHPYYMNLGYIDKARDYYQQALDIYKNLANREEAQLSTSTQQSILINQSFIRHRLAELSLYDESQSAVEGWKAMRSIREALNIENFVALPSKQRLFVLQMLLAEAYESLRIHAYADTWELLQKAQQLLAEDDISPAKRFKEVQYLNAFYHEITGHLYFLKGNINAALGTYTKIMRPNSDSTAIETGRYRYLITRVDSAFACMGFQQKSPQMKLQHFKYFEYARINLENLAKEYIDVPLLQRQSKRMNLTDKNKFCSDPIKFLLPPAGKKPD